MSLQFTGTFAPLTYPLFHKKKEGATSLFVKVEYSIGRLDVRTRFAGRAGKCLKKKCSFSSG